MRTLTTPSGDIPSPSALWQLRHQRLSLIEQGRFARAAQADALDGSTAPPVLRAESLRLRAIAYLLNEQPAEAATVFDQAAALAGGDDNMVAEIRLMQVEALHRAGQTADCAATWTVAVRQARGVRDPVLWERALTMKPPEAAWPDPAYDAAEIWMRVGDWYRARKAPSKALLAYANAQKECQDPIRQKQARIAQAGALLCLEQQGPALAILMNLVDDPEPSVSSHAMSLVGVVWIQQGQTARGLALLQKAVAAPPDSGWPERSQAVADLGLAYLMVGRKEEGLHELHEAQSLFREEGKTEDLAQSLLNEAAFLEGEGNKTGADALRQQTTATLAN